MYLFNRLQTCLLNQNQAIFWQFCWPLFLRSLFTLVIYFYLFTYCRPTPVYLRWWPQWTGVVCKDDCTVPVCLSGCSDLSVIMWICLGKADGRLQYVIMVNAHVGCHDKNLPGKNLAKIVFYDELWVHKKFTANFLQDLLNFALFSQLSYLGFGTLVSSWFMSSCHNEDI